MGVRWKRAQRHQKKCNNSVHFSYVSTADSDFTYISIQKSKWVPLLYWSVTDLGKKISLHRNSSARRAPTPPLYTFPHPSVRFIGWRFCLEDWTLFCTAIKQKDVIKKAFALELQPKIQIKSQNLMCNVQKLTLKSTLCKTTTSSRSVLWSTWSCRSESSSSVIRKLLKELQFKGAAASMAAGGHLW